ncbi:MAG: VCBS repeat-containing protein [Planctomycetota bacterium]
MTDLLRATLAAVLGLAAAVTAQTKGGLLCTLQPEVTLADFRAADLDGDGRAELVTASVDGEVRIWRLAKDSTAIAPSGNALALPHSSRSLLQLADLDGDGRPELLVFDDRGVEAHALDAQGEFVANARPITNDCRLRLRVGKPTFAELARDLNGDGHPDLVLPVADTFEIWLAVDGPAEADGHGAGLRFERAQTVPLTITHHVASGDGHLAERWSNELVVPALDVVDLNGDGRLDLRASEGKRRRFFLQGADGRFAQKPIEVDLSMFRDTTPKAGVELGETLVFDDDQHMESGDLDGDGIPDYVIAHRRKLWSFLSTKDGPQFVKADTRIVAEDISGLFLMRLDDDVRADLVTFKLEVPSGVQLALGLISSIDVPIHVLGYRTADDGGFDKSAQWNRTLTLRVPSLIRLLGDSANLIERFLSVISKLRWSTIGDFDGDGRRDLALCTEDESAVELWLSPKADDDEERAAEHRLRELLFENPDTVFDIERILKLAAQLLDARNAALTGERPADARAPLDKIEGMEIVDAFSADFDGDGRAETVIVRENPETKGQRRFDVLTWK